MPTLSRAIISLLLGTFMIAFSASPSIAATRTPPAPPCVIKKFLGAEYNRDCTARDAYNDLARDTVKHLKDTKVGASYLDRLSIVLMGGAANSNSRIDSTWALVRAHIYEAYEAKDYARAECIRYELLSGYMKIHSKSGPKDLAAALKFMSNFDGKAGWSALMTGLMKAAPKMAAAMTRYVNAYNSGMDAAYC